jgi:hypothetical protein
LNNKDEISKEDEESNMFGFNIWDYFTIKCFNGFTDATGGFY